MDRPAPTPNHPPNRVMPRAYKPLPPAAELWELFDYKPLTGELVRKSTEAVTGYLDKAGYCKVMLPGNRMCLAHRLIWTWGRGSDPADKEIDHKNHNRSDNRLWNLRLATREQNIENRKTPVRGWTWSVRKGKYRAQITTQGRTRHLGCYSTAEEAHNAYLTAKRELLIKGNKVGK